MASKNWRDHIYRSLVRLLGTLCYTPRGMLLYFPGYRGTFVTGYDQVFNPVNRRDPFPVDHFSLEPGFNRWHITASDKSRVQNLSVKQLAENMVFWFSMSVQQASEFEAICRKNTWSFQCPDNDARRRGQEVVRACEGAVFQIVKSPGPLVSNGTNFWHIEFVVSRKPVTGFPAPPLHLPPKPLADIRLAAGQFPARSHVVRLQNFEGAVIISVTLLPGTLSVPILLTHA